MYVHAQCYVFLTPCAGVIYAVRIRKILEDIGDPEILLQNRLGVAENGKKEFILFYTSRSTMYTNRCLWYKKEYGKVCIATPYRLPVPTKHWTDVGTDPTLL